MPREYGEMNPDGTVRTVRENDDGTYSIVNPNQPWWENQGLPDPNANRAQSNAGGNFNWPGLWGSLTGSNQKQFDEMVRQFNAQLEAELRKQASSMAQSLLSGATSLRGPESWLDYAQYTGGGKDIFKQLYGDIPSPLFGAPTGYSAPITMNDVLKALGLGGTASGGAGQAPQAGAPAAPSQPASPAPGGSTQPGQMPRVDLGASPDNSGDWEYVEFPDSSMGNPQPGQRYAQVITPGWRNKRTGEVRRAGPQSPYSDTYTGQPVSTAPGPGYNEQGGMAWSGPFAQNGPPNIRNEITDIDRAYNDAYSKAQAAANGGQSDLMFRYAPQGWQIGMPVNVGGQDAQMAPLPHQVNPAVWDSLSSTAKQMLLAAVEKGKTPSGAWSAEDYLTQMNNARPRGTAPKRVGYDFGNYGSYY